jgi:membrane protein YqaA with SNARE-associated domain
MRIIGQVTTLVCRPNWRDPQTLLRLGVFLAVVAMVVASFFLHNEITLEQYGYLGVGLIVLMASGGLLMPPGIIAVCAASSPDVLPDIVLTPYWVALIAGTAGTLGELTGYLLGYSGRGMVTSTRVYLKVESWMERRGWLIILLVSLVPNPFFDVVGIAAGALRYPVWRFLAIVWVGKLGRFSIIAYACAYSVEWLPSLFGA